MKRPFVITGKVVRVPVCVVLRLAHSSTPFTLCPLNRCNGSSHCSQNVRSKRYFPHFCMTKLIRRAGASVAPALNLVGWQAIGSVR
jgi:hypothetical protein